MRHRIQPLLLSILLFLATLPAWAQGGAEAGVLCRTAIEQAEQERAIPPRLLTAIARIESGRRDPRTGAFHPWPWTVNAEGVGSFHPTRDAAIAHVRSLQARGVRSIDVGCMQVNLRHHPNAFASLEDGFDPMANARYAAGFLAELQTARGSWQRATAAYHSSTPELGEPYRAKVEAAWLQEQRNASPATQLAATAPATPAAASSEQRGAAPLPATGGGIGGGFLLSNGGERASPAVTAMAGAGRGLDAYRSAPIPLVGRIMVAAPATAPGMGQGPPTPGGLGTRRLF